MINKIYDKFKVFMKENYIYLVLYILAIVLFLFKLPYYIYIGGGVIDISNRVEISEGYDSKGSLNLAYVSQIQATIPTYLLSYVMSDWELEKVENIKANSNETTEDIFIRDRIYLNTANEAAIRVAYAKAGKEVEVTNERNVIIFIMEEAETDLKVGDVIIKVDNQEFKEVEEIRNYLSTKEVNDKINITVLRDEKEVKCYAKIKEIAGEKLAGISMIKEYDLKTDPEVVLNFAPNESGPSGGMMTTLAIYDKLTEEDLTKGKKIVGTGTIDATGKVGAIGGVKFKLKGAVAAGADIFIVPNEENYEEVMKIKEEKKYDITIIGVDTFDDVVEALEKIN